MLWIRARWLPSTNTFTVPSGSLSICRMFEMQPILYRSSAVGSSLAADFCATSRMLLPASMAISIALIDFGRPTKSGMTMCGNTTTSRSGSSGYWLGADAVSSAMAFPGKRINSYIGAERPRSSRVPQGDDSPRSSRARHLRRFGVDEKGLAFADDGVLVHHDFAHILHRRKIEHEVEQHLFQDGTQAPGPGLSRQRLRGDRLQRLRPHLQIHSLHAEELLVLLDESVLRLGEYLDECLFVQFLQRRHDRQPPDELRYQPVLDKVFGFDRPQDLADVLAVLQASHVRAEADAALLGAAADDLLQAVERSAADEQDVGGVHLHEILVGMLAAALRPHGRDRPLDQLQQRLLHALAGNVPGDRRVVGLAADLVDLVDIDDAALRPLDVVVGRLQQLQDDVLDVLADVTCFRQGGGVRHGEGHVEDARQRLRQQRLAGAGRPDQQDIRFRQLDVVVLGLVVEPLVMVVDRDREHLLGVVLADDVVVEDLADLLRGRNAVARLHQRGLVLLADDVHAQLDALVADEHRRAGDELAHLVLALAAERAVKCVLGLAAADLAHPALRALPERRGARTSSLAGPRL